MSSSSESLPVVDVLMVAVAETAGSALYGLLDVLSAAGNLWQTLVRDGRPQQLFHIRIVSTGAQPFICGNGIPVAPHVSVRDDPTADIIILPELWLGPDEPLHGRYPELIKWLRRRYQSGSMLYSACSGSLMLAETGLLDGCPATSHWGYQDLFRQRYPKVRFDPAPNLVFADAAGRIVTAGGTTSWHDLALHIIARHASPGEAMRIAKVYLLKWHEEGDLPYSSLIRNVPHGDSIARHCQDFLQEHYLDHDVVSQVINIAGVPERTLKRRFRAATGYSLIEFVQNLRIEAAKKLLETSELPIDEISVQVGYSDASFFRRLFRRLTGLSPAPYRRMFQPLNRINQLR